MFCPSLLNFNEQLDNHYCIITKLFETRFVAVIIFTLYVSVCPSVYCSFLWAPCLK